jgi:hypothetical protein
MSDRGEHPKLKPPCRVAVAAGIVIPDRADTWHPGRSGANRDAPPARRHRGSIPWRDHLRAERGARAIPSRD